MLTFSCLECSFTPQHLLPAASSASLSSHKPWVGWSLLSSSKSQLKYCPWQALPGCSCKVAQHSRGMCFVTLENHRTTYASITYSVKHKWDHIFCKLLCVRNWCNENVFFQTFCLESHYSQNLANLYFKQDLLLFIPSKMRLFLPWKRQTNLSKQL